MMWLSSAGDIETADGANATHFIHVDADSTAAQPDFLRGKKHIESRAAAKVDHRLTLRLRLSSPVA
jgi:hypothetical protein